MSEQLLRYQPKELVNIWRLHTKHKAYIQISGRPKESDVLTYSQTADVLTYSQTADVLTYSRTADVLTYSQTADVFTYIQTSKQTFVRPYRHAYEHIPKHPVDSYMQTAIRSSYIQTAIRSAYIQTVVSAGKLCRSEQRVSKQSVHHVYNHRSKQSVDHPTMWGNV